MANGIESFNKSMETPNIYLFWSEGSSWKQTVFKKEDFF